MLASNADASWNMESMVVTEATFQSPIGELNAVAPRNVRSMFVTEDTSQEDKSSSKSPLPSNKP